MSIRSSSGAVYLGWRFVYFGDFGGKAGKWGKGTTGRQRESGEEGRERQMDRGNKEREIVG